MRRKLLIGILFVLAVGVVVAQEDPWYRPLSPHGQSLGIGYGTVTPTVANSGGDPANGELFVDMNRAANGGPQLIIYNATSAAWENVVANLGAGDTISFEGATADAFELDLEAADVGQDQDAYIGDYSQADISFVMATNDDMDIDEANAVWVDGANGFTYEGATADAFEVTIGAVDPIRDQLINFNNAVGDYVVTQRDGGGGYYGGYGVPNPWRHNFVADIADCTAQLDDYSAIAGAGDTNVNNVSCGTASFEFWVELAAAGGVAALLTPNADGWLVETDDTNNEGIQGMFFGADDDHDVGWGCIAQTDACYFEVNFSVTDSSETDQVLFGWLVRENYSADAEEDAFDTYALVGIDDAVADPRDIVISEELNGGGGANTDTLVNLVDGTNIAIRVVLQAAGTVDVYVNGVLTNNDVVTFDAADFAVPYFSIINAAGDGTPDPDVIIRYVEVGYLN